jgi:hypothetical protein
MEVLSMMTFKPFPKAAAVMKGEPDPGMPG